MTTNYIPWQLKKDLNLSNGEQDKTYCDYEDYITCKAGEVIGLRIQNMGDYRRYYTYFKIIDDKCYTYTTMWNEERKYFEPNCGGLLASTEIKEYIKKQNSHPTPLLVS